MGTVLFTREIINAIMNLHKIADELETMNDLKRKELLLKYDDSDLIKHHVIKDLHNKVEW